MGKHRIGEPYEFGGHGVDVRLYSAHDPSDVYWSPRWPEGGGHNSYVIVRDDRGPFRTPRGERVSLVSINGIGEERWRVEAYRATSFLRGEAKGEELLGDSREQAAAFHHFDLSLWDAARRTHTCSCQAARRTKSKRRTGGRRRTCRSARTGRFQRC